ECLRPTRHPVALPDLSERARPRGDPRYRWGDRRHRLAGPRRVLLRPWLVPGRDRQAPTTGDLRRRPAVRPGPPVDRRRRGDVRLHDGLGRPVGRRAAAAGRPARPAVLAGERPVQPRGGAAGRHPAKGV
ncbi:MAG: hypothetical protein AVDCRST_MAG33-881, partial [uncultured Thermomicrobiales bacterium]